MADSARLVVGITGASGVVYGKRLLEVLRGTDIETHLVMSKPAEMTVSYELEQKAADIKDLADAVYAPGDIGAAIASGSFRTMGMIIAPCSVRTMSEIATGVTAGLITRAADVMLKEKRLLTLMVRETPFHLGHLRTMTSLAEMGAVIAPPLPAFYAEPQSVDEIVTQSVCRVLDLYGIEAAATKRWGEDLTKGQR
ncbi:UbiX family flavin prenyltransferase [Parvularcula sp. IMCC14364]|uniref:UbiX family flavin prenyltransferase n=1 Tax=Parvularcula sp. IMCC14364 TaxID=3067902 RepID=UPI002740F568|nr:UbiX family flavin prenyltransferase [Parvularcula sp. IMCC14364]